MKIDIKIELRDPKELKFYENSPRLNADAVLPVANSIRKFGFVVPIVIDKDGVIVAGEVRVKASIDVLKLKKVPCIMADHLSPEEIKAFRIADNKTGEIALWDNEKLRHEMEGLLTDFNMEDFGFVEGEIAQLFETCEEILALNTTQEIDLIEFGDDRFECMCPKCGFRFNKKHE